MPERVPRSLRPPRQAWSSPRLTRRAGYPPPFTPVSRSDRGECRRARARDIADADGLRPRCRGEPRRGARCALPAGS